MRQVSFASLLTVVCMLGCGSIVDRMPAVGLQDEALAVQRLHPNAVGRACSSSVAGIPVQNAGSELARALAQVAKGHETANVLVDVEITWNWLTTGIYNRRCVEIRGDIGRQVPTVVVPSHVGIHE